MFDAYEVFEDGKLFATFVFVHGLDMPEEILCLAYMALNIVFFRFDPDVGRKVAEIKGALGLTTTLLSVRFSFKRCCVHLRVVKIVAFRIMLSPDPLSARRHRKLGW